MRGIRGWNHLSPANRVGRGIAGSLIFGFLYDASRRPVRCLGTTTPVPLQRRHPFRWDYGQEAFAPPVVFLCASQARPALLQTGGKPFSAASRYPACVSAGQRGTGPASPATRSGVSVAGRKEFRPGRRMRGFTGMSANRQLRSVTLHRRNPFCRSRRAAGRISKSAFLPCFRKPGRSLASFPEPWSG